MPGQPTAFDPRLAGELAVVRLLRRSAEVTGPGSEVRDRLRARVMTEFTEYAATHPAPESPSVRPSPVPRTEVVGQARRLNGAAVSTRPPSARGGTRPKGRSAGARGRLAIALGAAFCLVLALSGMTLLLSRGALPGDPLYAIRRTVESASVDLTSGRDAKGLKHLEFAAARVADIESLAARYPDPANSPVGDYLTAFADFDADAGAGTADLTGYATGNGPDLLYRLRDWAGQQTVRIAAVRAKLPTAAGTRAGASITLLGRIGQRATGLLDRNPCYTITSGQSDDLGVLPATGPCDQAPGPQGAPLGTPVPTPDALRTVGPTRSAGNGPAAPAPAPATPTPTGTATPARTQPPVAPAPTAAGPTAPVPPVPTPTLPVPLPTLTLGRLVPGLPALTLGGGRDGLLGG